MKRFCYLIALMAFSSSAHAGSFSFVIGGHRIHIAASRHCYSPSCVSVSIPGVYSTRRKGNRYWNDGVDTAPDLASAKTAPAVEQVAAVAAPVPPQTAAPLPIVVPPAVAPPKRPPVTVTAPVTPPTTPPVEIPTARVPPAADAAPQLLKISHDKNEEPAETPLGDWQTEGKTGSVRIQYCGHALCGYMLNASSNTVGESVLINMKPKSAEQWSGNIFSRASGSTYYATISMKGANSLRVEACALGRFFCSGNVWTRIADPRDQISARQVSPPPRS
jgi:uncharacterized protein (DUF2147 family)